MNVPSRGSMARPIVPDPATRCVRKPVTAGPTSKTPHTIWPLIPGAGPRPDLAEMLGRKDHALQEVHALALSTKMLDGIPPCSPKAALVTALPGVKRQAMTGGQLNTPLNARQGNPHAVNAEPWGKNITQTFFPHPAIAQITDVPRIAARGRGRARASRANVATYERNASYVRWGRHRPNATEWPSV